MTFDHQETILRALWMTGRTKEQAETTLAEYNAWLLEQVAQASPAGKDTPTGGEPTPPKCEHRFYLSGYCPVCK